MNLKTVTVADLRPHPANPNTHPAKQIDALGDSLDEFDQVKNVVIWRGMMLAGHAVREAAIKSGRLTLDAVDVSHWDEAKATAFMLADIRLPDMGVYDEAAMVEALREVEEPLGIPGIDEEFLKGLEGWEVKGAKDAPPIEPGAVEKAQAVWQVKEGDVWQLGRHKIACIDSLDGGAVKALIGSDEVGMVWADPPYGISAVVPDGTVGYSFYPKGTYGQLADKNTYAPIIGDDTTETALKAFALCENLDNAIQIWWGGNYYASELPRAKCWIVWDKQTDGNEFADCEIAWTNLTGRLRLFRHTWNGMIKASEQGQRRIHPTQKPVALFEWAANKYFKDGGVAFDPFLGSGISIMGAESIGDTITVIGCEIVPEYIAAVIQRWVDLTAGTPELTK